jgi:hypothetical protein
MAPFRHVRRRDGLGGLLHEVPTRRPLDGPRYSPPCIGCGSTISRLKPGSDVPFRLFRSLVNASSKLSPIPPVRAAETEFLGPTGQDRPIDGSETCSPRLPAQNVVSFRIPQRDLSPGGSLSVAKPGMLWYSRA